MRILVTFILFITLVSVGCTERQKGPFERAGERADEIGDNVREGDPLLKKKGAAERTGEAIDDTFNTNRK